MEASEAGGLGLVDLVFLYDVIVLSAALLLVIYLAHTVNDDFLSHRALLARRECVVVVRRRRKRREREREERERGDHEKEIT